MVRDIHHTGIDENSINVFSSSPKITGSRQVTEVAVRI